MTLSEAALELQALPRAEGARCPACGADDLRIFFEQDDVPVHSCRLVPTRKEAEDFLTGSLELGFCPRCGFVTNTAHDPSLQSYFDAYEETQGFSPHFQGFLRELASRWIQRYGLEGKDVLEIGCGKGEFLLTMCELGVARGVGIDPAVAPERNTGPASQRVEYIRALYSEQYTHLTGDAIVCRHTLEHIGPVADFMKMVRQSIDNRPGAVVLFELPDAMRVLREAAFWDVYYEHCSYFTPGSLARLFRSTGFEVLAVEMDYDAQYILIEARAGSGPSAPQRLEESPEEVLEAAVSFGNDLAAIVERWREELRSVRGGGGRTVIWGAGSKGVAFLTTGGLGADVSYAVDINPYKQGMFMAGTGHEIVSPEFLHAHPPELVVAMNPVYLDEIRASLDRLGMHARLTAV